MLFDNLGRFENAPRAIIIAGSLYTPFDDTISEVVSLLLDGVLDRDRDILYLDNTSRSIGIDATREFFSLLKTKSQSGRRIAIVKRAESMTVSAANAILKSLEEPDDETIILLTTVQLHALPATIRSRCAVYRIANRCVSDDSSWTHRYAHGNSGLVSVLEADPFSELDEAFCANGRARIINGIQAGLAEVDALEIYLRGAFMDALSMAEQPSGLATRLMRIRSLDQIEGRLLRVLTILRQHRTQHLDKTQTSIRIASVIG